MNSQSNVKRQLKQEDKPTGDVIHIYTFNVDQFLAKFIIIGNYNFYAYKERFWYLKIYRSETNFVKTK